MTSISFIGFVNSERRWRTEAVEHGHLAMIQIRQSKHSAVVIRLYSVFAHSDALPYRMHWDDEDRRGDSTKGGAPSSAVSALVKRFIAAMINTSSSLKPRVVIFHMTASQLTRSIASLYKARAVPNP